MRKRAEAFAREMHAGQVDKAGQPYIGHLERVVANLLRRWPDATEDEIAAAWLHDVLEDTNAQVIDLHYAGMSDRVLSIVAGLTRPKLVPLPYLTWIGYLAEEADQSVIRVKLADNEDNSDPARVAALPCGPKMLEQRYKPARAILERALVAAE